MKTWLTLMLLLFTLQACGGPGQANEEGSAIEDESLSLARRHLETGLALHESGRFLDAVQEYDLALHLNPYYAEAYVDRGLAHAQ